MHIIRKYPWRCLLLAAVAAVYAPSLWNGFINIDDALLVTENTHVLVPSFANIWYVLTHFDPELYIPVTFFSYQIETWTLGLHAWHFHLISLLLHMSSVLFVWSIVQRLTKSELIGGVTAALFALHPLNAEAVLWASARKDILSAFFFLASLRAYLGYRETERKKTYVWSIVFFVLALGSKVTTVTLPLALLAIEWKKDGTRTSMKKLWPFFALAMLFGIVAIVGKTTVGKTLELEPMIVMAFRSILFYLKLTVMPAGQAIMHAVPKTQLWNPELPLAIALVVGLTFALQKAAKKLPALWWGWAFFLLTLAPTLLHYTRGQDAYMLASERYAYLPSIGIFLIIAIVWSRLFMLPQNSRVTRIILATGSVSVILVLGLLTELRVFVFRDSVILNMDTLQKHPGDSMSSYNLGRALETDKRPMQAEIAYASALNIKPDYADAAISLGILFLREGRTEEGVEMLERASTMKPDSFKGYYNLGVAYQNISEWNKAATAFEKTIALFPDFPDAHRNLANAYGKLGKFKEAVRELEILAALDPSVAEALAEAKKKL